MVMQVTLTKDLESFIAHKVRAGGYADVILAALRSQAGASHRLLMTIGHPQWQSVVTPALMYESD